MEPAGPGEAAKHHMRYMQGLEEQPAGMGTPDPQRQYRRLVRELPPDRVGHLRLLIGHFSYGFHEALPFPADYITLIRDPVPRVLSMYAHRTAHQGLTRALADYVAEARDWEVDNGQTRRLAGLAGSISITPRQLEQAKANLRTMRVVGVTERFDEFVALLGIELGWRPHAYLTRNVSEDRPRERDLDPAILEAIRERNALDVDLHRYAGELMDARIAERRPEVEARLRAIRRRNGVFANPVAIWLRERARDARASMAQLVRPRVRGS